VNPINDPKHILAASVVVLQDGEILLIKSPKRGWEFPGGQVEVGESITDAAIREVKEETGINVEITKFCGIFQNVQRGISCFLFLGRSLGGDFTLSDESLEVGFYSVEQALEMITWSNYRERIMMCLHEPHPFLVEF
jgi:8-oxo-dGTP diphosphatase